MPSLTGHRFSVGGDIIIHSTHIFFVSKVAESLHVDSRWGVIEDTAFTIGQAAQRAPQKTTDPALAGSARTRCPRTHSWCDRHTPAL